MKHYRRSYKKPMNPRKQITCVLWSNLTDEQKEKITQSFSYLANRLPEGTYQSWLESHGYYFDYLGSHLITSMTFDGKV